MSKNFDESLERKKYHFGRLRNQLLSVGNTLSICFDSAYEVENPHYVDNINQIGFLIEKLVKRIEKEELGSVPDKIS